jgi:hypothetical protein
MGAHDVESTETSQSNVTRRVRLGLGTLKK